MILRHFLPSFYVGPPTPRASHPTFHTSRSTPCIPHPAPHTLFRLSRSPLSPYPFFSFQADFLPAPSEKGDYCELYVPGIYLPYVEKGAEIILTPKELKIAVSFDKEKAVILSGASVDIILRCYGSKRESNFVSLESVTKAFGDNVKLDPKIERVLTNEINYITAPAVTENTNRGI